MSSDIDTQFQMVPAPEPRVLPPRAAHRWWALPLMLVSLVVLLGILVLSVLPSTLDAENAKNVEAPYALVPADAQPVASRLAFDAVERYPASGEMLFVTVREPEITLLDWLIGKDEPEVQPLSYEDKYGTQTPDQQRQINVQMMRTAKENAEYVALNFLGYPVELIPGKVMIDYLVCLEANEEGTECLDYAPSDDLLDPGDELLEVDGVELVTIDDLGPILAKHQPGDEVEVRFNRAGEGEKTGTVELIASNDGTDRTIIGFRPSDTATTELPFDVTIDSGAIGGPSAGLAFTLTLIDELTPGELTGGGKVAVTGTISINGDVGAIGGLAQKTSAVKQMGAKVFLVPTAQGEEDIARAREVAGDELEVVPVANLQEAIDALATYGGNGLELGTPGADYQPAD